VLSSDDDSDLDTINPTPVVRQVFGLLVGKHVQLKLREKILADSYIDMYDLLPEAATMDKSLILKAAKKGDGLNLLRESKTKYITLDQWNQAFASYMAVYVSKAKTHIESYNLMLEMLTYQRDVNSLARQELSWWKYDIQFRMDRSVDPDSFTFATLRHDIIANIKFTPRTKQPFRQVGAGQSPFRSNQQTTTQNQSGYQPNTQRQNGAKQRVPQGFCFRFHQRSQTCPNRQNCKFNHTCPCCSSRHPLYQCTN
jgi:hypothetical protein